MDRRFLFPVLILALAGCEQLGFDDPAKAAAMKEAEGKAIGSGCRHVGRALEDCYAQNLKASKAAIFAGWREMDGYMRENQIQNAKPEGEEEAPPAKQDAEKKAPAGEGKGDAKEKKGAGAHGAAPIRSGRLA